MTGLELNEFTWTIIYWNHTRCQPLYLCCRRSALSHTHTLNNSTQRPLDCPTHVFPRGLAGVFWFSAAGFGNPGGFKISLQVSNWKMTFNPELALGWVGGIHFRICWLGFNASLSLLPGSRLPHGKACYPWSLPPLHFYPCLLHFLPSLWQDRTRQDNS